MCNSQLLHGYSTSDVMLNTSEGLSNAALKKSNEVGFISLRSQSLSLFTLTAGETETLEKVTHLLSRSAI